VLIVVAHNDGTGSDHDANYNVEIRINDIVIASGYLMHHDRNSGWRGLLRQIAGSTDVSELNVTKAIVQSLL
jgi:hypothetical protein